MVFNEWTDWATQPRQIRRTGGPTAMDMITTPAGPAQDAPRISGDDSMEADELVVGPGDTADPLPEP